MVINILKAIIFIVYFNNKINGCMLERIAYVSSLKKKLLQSFIPILQTHTNLNICPLM